MTDQRQVQDPPPPSVEPETSPPMNAGRELDALIVERVFGLTGRTTVYAWNDRKARKYPAIGFPCDLPYGSRYARRDYGTFVNEAGEKMRGAVVFPAPFSTDIAAAWQVVEKVCETGAHFDLMRHTQYAVQWSAHFPNGMESPSSHAYQLAATAPLAICLAALSAVSPEEDGNG